MFTYIYIYIYIHIHMYMSGRDVLVCVCVCVCVCVSTMLLLLLLHSTAAPVRVDRLIDADAALADGAARAHSTAQQKQKHEPGRTIKMTIKKLG